MRPAAVKGIFFPNLDGLRFVAFLSVFLAHAFGLVIPGDTAAGRFVGQLVSSGGGLGVSLFFVLSGFLITYLLLVEHGAFGAIDIRAFYVRRCLRIWPLYFLVLVLALVVYPATKAWLGFPSTIDVGNPLLYWTFLGNLDVVALGGHGAGITSITWSVAIEEQFYLLWPLLLVVMRPQRAGLLSALVMAASSGYRFVHRHDAARVYFHTMSVLSDLAIGGFLAHLCHTHPAFVARVRDLRKGTISSAYVLGLGGMFWFLGVGNRFAGLTRLLAASFFAFIIVEQNYAVASPFKMVESRVATFLGRYTYGLYLWHVWCLLLLHNAFRLRASDSARWPITFGLVGFVASVGVAMASYHWYERPFLALKERFSRVSTGKAVGETGNLRMPSESASIRSSRHA